MKVLNSACRPVFVPISAAKDPVCLCSEKTRDSNAKFCSVWICSLSDWLEDEWTNEIWVTHKASWRWITCVVNPVLSEYSRVNLVSVCLIEGHTISSCRKYGSSFLLHSFCFLLYLYSNESCWVVLSCGTDCCAVLGGSNFWVCGWNPKVWPFKWKLLSSTFLWYCLLCCTWWF